MEAKIINLEKMERYVRLDDSHPSGLWAIPGTACSVDAVPTGKFRPIPDGVEPVKYWRVQIEDERFAAHRIAWTLRNGPIPLGHVVDHIDGDTLNNVPKNLRAVSPTVNARNRGRSRRSRTGSPGVSYDPNRDAWVCTGPMVDGSTYRETFSCATHGARVAYVNAVALRNNLMADLRLYGSGYSDRFFEESFAALTPELALEFGRSVRLGCFVEKQRTAERRMKEVLDVFAERFGGASWQWGDRSRRDCFKVPPVPAVFVSICQEYFSDDPLAG